jgi:hypothetical protein
MFVFGLNIMQGTNGQKMLSPTEYAGLKDANPSAYSLVVNCKYKDTQKNGIN